ncbi:uncharacterized protein N7459_005636 [Penicillium hispanicum]|uniref:uncharacterized protein n=1 Tax=Penicillium hispanicum TaxID=1080232 RepID=UPI0025413803|nr:uncharacterized protein N7459_005636 [Penicillium hispanicum]KAJ5579651.1 hypothetical protein N7459_005636 [Penicillium hispanicum]
MTDAAKQNAWQLTRCRMGCSMRCRIRRRKCMPTWTDQNQDKPRCRNCIDRNFQCQYWPYLTFLTKYAHIVQKSEIRALPRGYQVIRFVTEEPQKEPNDQQEEWKERPLPLEQGQEAPLAETHESPHADTSQPAQEHKI